MSAKRCCALSSAIMHRDRSGESEIRQHQARIIDRHLQGGPTDEARREHADHQRHHNADEADRQLRRPRHSSSRARGRRKWSPLQARRLLGIDPLPGRDQRRIQRAFGEQTPDNIDQLERDQKRIRAIGPAPSSAATIASRTKPSRREAKRAGRNGQDIAEHRNMEATSGVLCELNQTVLVWPALETRLIDRV